MADSVKQYDRMTALADLTDQVLRNIRTKLYTSENGRKDML